MAVMVHLVRRMQVQAVAALVRLVVMQVHPMRVMVVRVQHLVFQDHQ